MVIARSLPADGRFRAKFFAYANADAGSGNAHHAATAITNAFCHGQRDGNHDRQPNRDAVSDDYVNVYCLCADCYGHGQRDGNPDSDDCAECDAPTSTAAGCVQLRPIGAGT
jgi:hypothetical protein